MGLRKAPLIALFFVAGLGAAAVSLLLAWWLLPLLFLTDGLILCLFLAPAFGLCRKLDWIPPGPARRRYWEAMALLVFGYPVAELFGTLLSLICEGVLLATPTAWHSAHEPLIWIGLLSFWGTLAAAFCVNLAVMVVSDHWNWRTLGLLLLAGVISTAVALSIYLPRYQATEGFAAKYRELVLFGTLLPLGNTLYSALAGYGLTTSEKVGHGFTPMGTD